MADKGHVSHVSLEILGRVHSVHVPHSMPGPIVELNGQTSKVAHKPLPLFHHSYSSFQILSNHLTRSKPLSNRLYPLKRDMAGGPTTSTGLYPSFDSFDFFFCHEIVFSSFIFTPLSQPAKARIFS